MTAIDANGVGLFYEEKGDGQPLLFVHGIVNDYRCWKYQTEAFSGKYRTVVYSRRYSWPNSRSGDLSDSTVQNNASDLDAIIEKLGIGPVHLVGHSYGGFIACYFATQHPEKIRSLTLVNAAVATMVLEDPDSPLAALSLLLRSPSIATSAAGYQRRAKAALKALDAGDMALTARLVYTGLWDNPNDAPKLSEDLEKMMVDNARTIRESKTKFPRLTAAEAMKIKKPTMVVRGGGSARWDLKISEKLAAAIPGSESVLISRAGHFCHFENPGEFNSRLTDFLAKHS